MTEKPANLTPEQAQALEEAKRKFEELKAQLDRATHQAQDVVRQHLLVARERLAYAESEGTRAAGLRDRLAPHQDRPEVAEHHTKMAMLATIYDEMRAMTAAEIAQHEKNLAEIATIPPLEPREDFPSTVAVVIPGEDVAYREHRLRMEVAMLDYHWYRNRAALDAVMRAADIDTAGYGAPGDPAAQAAAAQALKAAMGQDRDTAILVGRLGPEIEEAYALLDWAQDSMKSFAQLPAAAKKAAFADPDWAKLNGRLAMIMELSERVQGVPALAPLFPYAPDDGPGFKHQPVTAGALR